MRILLIAPATGRWLHIGRKGIFGGRTFRFSLLSLLAVAAETPEEHSVTICDEQIDEIDPQTVEADLVGITCMTSNAPRAYEFAADFRQRGIPVVLGGIHPTLCPDEAREHADAILIGDAEGLWPTIVRDAENGNLQPIYRHEQKPSLAKLNPLPRHLLDSKKYASIHPVQATRGCPHQCSFCSIAAAHQSCHRQRPVEEVVAEIRQLPGKLLVFVDDNLTANRDYARELFRAMKPLKKRWITQSDLQIADDPDFVADMATAGCVGVFVGLETFRHDNLTAVDKTSNRVEGYQKAINTLHRHGIDIEAGIVFGFPRDTPETFAHTLSMLSRLDVDAVQVSIFTPLPGTPAHRSMQTKIFDREWEHYDFHHVVFEPELLTAEQLKQGHDWVTRQFYRPRNILKRFLRHLVRPARWRALTFLLSVNLAYLGRIRRWHISGSNPALNQTTVKQTETTSCPDTQPQTG